MSKQFAILNPCQKELSELRGSGRERHCEACQTSVHAIAQYSEEEWAQVWHDSGGHVCGILCEESPPEPRSRRAVLVGALLTFISPLMAQAGRLRIRVTDASGGVISTAEASLLGPDDKPTQTEEANEKGEIVFTDLPFGVCRFAVMALGFSTRRLNITLRNGEELKTETSLQVGPVVMGVFVTVDGTPPKPSPTPSAVAPAPPIKKSAKRRWWLIFR